jgi:2,5-furandicarboxylate decarboxylase 1
MMLGPGVSLLAKTTEDRGTCCMKIDLAGPRTGSFRDIREYLDALDSAGLLARVTAPVDLQFEIGAICARSMRRGGPALLFENVRDLPGMKLSANLLSSTRHLAVAFGTDEDEEVIYQRIVDGMSHRLPSVLVSTGPCKDEIFHGDAVDLFKFPTPTWHELDGGAYICTTAGVITRHPETGVLNMGSYRSMIKDSRTITLTAGSHGDPGARDHITLNEAKNRPTPIAIALGMDPFLSLATGTQVPADDEGQAEFEAAGAWRSSPTELVQCETSDLLVPAHAEIILEGEVVPTERTTEGPHGESTGFYGENKNAYVVRINCITHRHEPLSYGLICQLLEDYPRSLLRSGSLQTLLIKRTGKTNIRHVYMPEIGRAGMLIVSAEIQYAEEPREIIDAVWGVRGWRWAIVVDEDCDVRDWNDVMWRVVSAAEPKNHVIESPWREGNHRGPDEMEFEPPEHGIGIDATFRFKGYHPPINKVSQELDARVASRWRELGLP